MKKKELTIKEQREALIEYLCSIELPYDFTWQNVEAIYEGYYDKKHHNHYGGLAEKYIELSKARPKGKNETINQVEYNN